MPRQKCSGLLIPLNGGWRILSDPTCWTIQKKTKKGKWVDMGFYGTLNKALGSVFMDQVGEIEGDVRNSIDTVLRIQREIEDQISKINSGEVEKYTGKMVVAQGGK